MRMKNNVINSKLSIGLFIVVMIVSLQSCMAQSTSVNTALSIDSENKTSSFYDNSEFHSLATIDLYVEGELEKSGKVDFSKFQLQELIVKETLLKDGKADFIGAYKYVGYSLYDILNDFIIAKANAKEFPPEVDLYVEIENDNGEKVVVSWGEIYYANRLHEIIIATSVARIVPVKSKNMWELPTESKLVFGNDLITSRNISNPVKITIKSYSNDKIEIIKGKKPTFSPTVDLIVNDEIKRTYDAKSDYSAEQTVHTIFYGKGRGLHSTEPFDGLCLSNILEEVIERNTKNLKHGLVVVLADDGYRTIYTLSELINRNDQSEVLLVRDVELTDNGIFRLYPSCDFFSDRSIKGISQIVFIEN